MFAFAFNITFAIVWGVIGFGEGNTFLASVCGAHAAFAICHGADLLGRLLAERRA
jgi:hypothetical protein